MHSFETKGVYCMSLSRPLPWPLSRPLSRPLPRPLSWPLSRLLPWPLPQRPLLPRQTLGAVPFYRAERRRVPPALGAVALNCDAAHGGALSYFSILVRFYDK